MPTALAEGGALEAAPEPPGVWGIRGAPVLLALALVSYDLDDQDVADSSDSAPGSPPPLDAPAHGLVGMRNRL